MFARKPAPIQVTYLAYPNTTGMSAMDYRISDAVCDPPGATERYYRETLIRLPRCMWCYRQDRSATLRSRWCWMRARKSGKAGAWGSASC